jgi:hypothetical protein
MRAGGAMALLCGNFDADTIRLVGGWKSDVMFRYLHTQALPLVKHLAATMLRHSDLALAAPGTTSSNSFIFLSFLFPPGASDSDSSSTHPLAGQIGATRQVGQGDSQM